MVFIYRPFQYGYFIYKSWLVCLTPCFIGLEAGGFSGNFTSTLFAFLLKHGSGVQICLNSVAVRDRQAILFPKTFEAVLTQQSSGTCSCTTAPMQMVLNQKNDAKTKVCSQSSLIRRYCQSVQQGCSSCLLLPWAQQTSQ